MILAIFLVIASALALAFVFGITVSRSLQASRGGRALPIQPLDIQAFRNLVDPAEADYLRRRLSAGEFRNVQRERLLAMAAYVQAAGQNASLLISLGERALASNDPQTAEAARQLVNHALLLRQNTFLALMRIRAAWLWPHSGVGMTPIVSGYERLNGSAMLLGRLQNPAVPVRISASL
jgi:hypothetical protein